MNVRRAIFFTFVLEASIAVSAVILFGFSLHGLQTTTRYSGRLSLLIFSVIFLTQNEKLKRWLSEKPYLVFALAHGVHLVELLAYVYLSGTKLIPYRIAGGFTAYVFIFLMPVFAYYYQRGKISAMKMFIIETVFQYYVWLILFLTYLTRVLGYVPNSGGNYWEHVALLGWVTMMLGTKLTMLFQSKLTRK